MRSAPLLACTLALLLAGACVRAAPALDLRECAVNGATEKARCGRLEVPENWNQPTGRRISLNIVVIPAAGGATLPPLFDLAGGPGLGATIAASFYLTDGAALRAERDIVLVDQRGTGDSSPLRCPALEKGTPLARMYPPEQVRTCRDALARDHDLTQYTTLAATRDLDAVRAALGAEKIDLFGLSYGTKLAQAYVRTFPRHVRAVSLLSAAPMDLRTPLYHARNAENVLRAILADCAADGACATAYPGLADEWNAVIARFAGGPVTMPTPDGELAVERGPFMEALRAFLVSEGNQRKVPMIVSAAAKGDFAPFVKATTSGPRGAIAEGMYLSVECAEGSALIDPAEIDATTSGTFLGRYRVDEQRAACAEWPQAEVPREFAEPVRGEMPVLLLVGGRDYVTPGDYAERIAKGFANARVIRIEPMGHYPEAISNIECLDAMMVAFHRSADPGAVDASCVAAMQAPPFALP